MFIFCYQRVQIQQIFHSGYFEYGKNSFLLSGTETRHCILLYVIGRTQPWSEDATFLYFKLCVHKYGCYQQSFIRNGLFHSLCSASFRAGVSNMQLTGWICLLKGLKPARMQMAVSCSLLPGSRFCDLITDTITAESKYNWSKNRIHT